MRSLRVDDPAPNSIGVAVFAPAFPPASRGGGPIRSLEAMVAGAPPPFIPYVLTPDRDLGMTEPLPVTRNAWVRLDRGFVYYASLGSLGALVRAFRELRARRAHMLYLSSFFNPVLTILPVVLWRLGFWGSPVLLLAPRGEFGAGALSRRSRKKQLYLGFFRLLGLHRSVIWHSTAEHESADIRRLWGEDARVVFRENATLLPSKASIPEGWNVGPLRATFVGRIVEHKGLAIALAALRECTSPLSFDIYGAHEDAVYFAHCQSLAAQLPAGVTVTFHADVPSSEVRGILADHDALILPTAGENFGHVIAEALSCSCLVATTPETPWTQTLSAGGGMVVADRSPEAWAGALEALAALDPAQRAERRRAAGEAYAAWAARPKADHVWQLTIQQYGPPGRS